MYSANIYFELLLVVCMVGGFFSTIGAAEPAQNKPQHIIWTDTPLVLDPKPQRPIKYFQDMWGSSVYPIGNGRLGATSFGGLAEERIEFNEDTLWSGDEEQVGAYKAFGRMFIALDNHDADPKQANYRRELNIERAVHTISYEIDGVEYRREYIASKPDNVMVFRLTASKKGAYTGSIRLEDAHAHNGGPNTAEGDTITFTGKIKPQKINLEYEAQAKVLHEGGSIRVIENRIHFTGCDSITILLDAGTNYINQRTQGWKREHPHERINARLAAAAKRSYDVILADHIKDHQSLFDRMTLDLGETPEATRNLTTKARMDAYKAGKPDPDLEETLYQHARYLMIGCSRPGNLPANLQGLWNPYRWPPWRSDYHTDVNVQMNYWFVNQANLSECFLPLAEWVHSIREVRREATKKEFGTRGWAFRSMNNIFGGDDYHWVPGDAAWVAQNLWDHYAFTLDKDYLRDRAYPIMKELCWYWEDSLIERPDGTLVSPKAQSPEHGPHAEGNSYDMQLCYDLFTNFIEASKALGVDEEYRKKIAEMRSRLLKPQIGKWGQLQEWEEDLDSQTNTHRHLSHLIAVHPGRQISPQTTPKLAEAAKVSMNARGDGRTGWSKAWKISIWARLHDGDRAYKLANEFIKHNVYDNLWGFHPPFQIDCNFGYASGVNEMLLQSHMGFVHFLPALPSAWPAGSVKGMRVRGGFEVDFAWKDGKLTAATIRNISNPTGECKVRYNDTEKTLSIPKGSAVEPTFASNKSKQEQPAQ